VTMPKMRTRSAARKRNMLWNNNQTSYSADMGPSVRIMKKNKSLATKSFTSSLHEPQTQASTVGPQAGYIPGNQTLLSGSVDYTMDNSRSRMNAYAGSIYERQGSSKGRKKSNIRVSKTELTKSSVASIRGLTTSKKKPKRRS
jgi:hypothetical protein